MTRLAESFICLLRSGVLGDLEIRSQEYGRIWGMPSSCWIDLVQFQYSQYWGIDLPAGHHVWDCLRHAIHGQSSDQLFLSEYAWVIAIDSLRPIM